MEIFEPEMVCFNCRRMKVEKEQDDIVFRNCKKELVVYNTPCSREHLWWKLPKFLYRIQDFKPRR